MPMEQNGTLEERAREFISSTAPLGQNCSIVLVKPEEVDIFWDHVEDYIQQSSLRSYYGCKSEHIYHDIVTEESLLWAILDGREAMGALITTVHEYPNMRSLQVNLVGGENTKDWIELVITFMESWAIGIGCSYIEGIGRKGWKKYFPDYDTNSVVFTKELKSRKH